LRELEPDNEEQMARLKEILTSAKLDKRFSDMTTGGGKTPQDSYGIGFSL
jgi:hypothetical protein